MARPGNWRELIAQHGWGDAPARLMARTRRVGDCLEVGSDRRRRGRRPVIKVPQIRIRVSGLLWTESVARFVYMFCSGEFVERERDVKRSCDNPSCCLFGHLVTVGNGVVVNDAQRLRLARSLRASPKFMERRMLSPQQVATIRRYRKKARPLTPLIDRYGVKAPSIYNVANGFSYREPGEPMPSRGMVGVWNTQRRHRFDREACDEMLSMIAGGESYNAVAAYFDCRNSQVGHVVRGLYRRGVGGLTLEDRPTEPRAVCGQCCLTADDCGCVKWTAGSRRCSGCDRIAGHNVRTCRQRT